MAMKQLLPFLSIEKPTPTLQLEMLENPTFPLMTQMTVFRCWMMNQIITNENLMKIIEHRRSPLITLPKNNIAPENMVSQKEIHLPTIRFQVLC